MHVCVCISSSDSVCVCVSVSSGDMSVRTNKADCHPVCAIHFQQLEGYRCTFLGKDGSHSTQFLKQ